MVFCCVLSVLFGTVPLLLFSMLCLVLGLPFFVVGATHSNGKRGLPWHAAPVLWRTCSALFRFQHRLAKHTPEFCCYHAYLFYYLHSFFGTSKRVKWRLHLHLLPLHFPRPPSRRPPSTPPLPRPCGLPATPRYVMERARRTLSHYSTSTCISFLLRGPFETTYCPPSPRH